MTFAPPGPGSPPRVRFGPGESAARHFVAVLDPRTSAGPSVSLGLTYRTLPGLAATLLPSVLLPSCRPVAVQPEPTLPVVAGQGLCGSMSGHAAVSSTGGRPAKLA